MTNCAEEIRHQLSGEWTISEIDSQFNSLNETLRKLPLGGKKSVQVDCAGIGSIDMSGLQLIHVWMECAKMQGVTVELMNTPNCMRQSIRQLGFEQYFTENGSVTA